MNRRMKFLAVPMVLVLVASLLLAIPVFGASVTPIHIEDTGNFTCQQLADQYSPGSIWFELKFDPNPISVDPTIPDTLSTPLGSVTVLNGTELGFDWSSTFGIDAVFVKNGRDGHNLYIYDSAGDPNTESFGDSGLMPPGNNAISHISFCYDYELIASKTANATWYKTIDWTLTKDVTPASASAFIGGSANFDYTVTLTKNETFGPYVVEGKIYVTNPAPSPVSFSVADSAGGTAATVSCPTYTLAAGASTECTYSVSLAGPSNGTNTATITSNTADVGGTTATADYAFGEPILSEGSEPEEISVTDTLAGDLGSFSASGTAEYRLTQDCSDDPDDYAGDGIWSQDYPNTASINETTGDSDSESVTLTCYAPVITKDAAASYDERHIWDVEKTVDPESQGGFPGDELPWTWTVTVSETFVEEDFAVSGTIYVANPAGSPGNITVSLVDKLNDGTLATVDCGGGATSVTVAPGASATCAYTAAPSGRTATLNKATGTFNRIDFVATYPVSFTKNVVNGTATVTDTEIGLNDDLTAGAGPWESTKDYSHTCSTDRADYFVDGVYTQIAETITNWAYVYSDGEEQDKDDAETTYTCDASFVDIYKTTNGAPADPTKDIRFALYSGTTLLSTVSTLNQGSALAFATALVPGDVYTICEYPVPAGYTFEISVNGGNVLTYAGPPGETNPTGEIQCFDFTAQSSGTTVTYDVNNRYPGGAPRTPGYWKNWNRCTGGNQAATADKLNDYLGPIDGAGVFLLNDLLPQTLGSWTVETCQVGVYILDSRDTSGKNMASDAAYTLAKALLAARLNQDAGACVPMDLTTMFPGETRTFEEVLTAADALLSSIKFNGTGSYLGPQVKKDLLTKRNTALYLYGIIDAYNNSKLCTGEPSH
ncbi:MAG: hypothetical protein HPY83_05150 [Anaerolineae bacterium]|nr:hypothetical protein [Anaerolineae bacterium]